jgi:transketolase
MEKTIRQQFADTMLEVGQKDPKLVVLVGDISHFILQPFAKACPGRYYNVGICEPTIMSMAAGMAKSGLVPVVHTIAPFLIERSFEQMKLDFCYQGLGGNIVTLGSAFDYSNLGCSHHCYGDFALMKTLPNAEIVYPGSAVEWDALFRQAYTRHSLKLFRLPGKSHGEKFSGSEIRLGSGRKVTDGQDLTLIATGPQLRSALDARPALSDMGFETEILYIHTIRPLDTELILSSVRKTKKVLVIEEHMRSGGLGDEVLRGVRDLESVRFVSLSIPDQFVTQYGSYEEHCARLGLSSQGIVQAVRESFKGVPAWKSTF